jgi:hypothetical protein
LRTTGAKTCRTHDRTGPVDSVSGWLYVTERERTKQDRIETVKDIGAIPMHPHIGGNGRTLRAWNKRLKEPGGCRARIWLTAKSRSWHTR